MPDYRAPGVYVEEVPSAIKPIAGVSTSTAGFIGVVPDTIQQIAKDPAGTPENPTKWVEFTVPTPVNTAKLITNWTQFTVAFGNLVGTAPETTAPPPPTPPPPPAPPPPPPAPPPARARSTGHDQLAHAVYGFFNNGGSRCFVVRIAAEDNLDAALKALAPIDEIALVAAPGLVSPATREKIVSHCKATDRFAILDGPQTATDQTTLTKTPADSGVMPQRTDYAAWYFPWIKVFDPATKLQNPAGDGSVGVPPSGHLTGVYARVDAERGVHKAPANEAILGALDVTQAISKADQMGLNPDGVNCIRVLNANVLVWGARTVGGDANADLKYVNVRRTLLFLRKSIEQGTQWVVFEPNSPALWQRITRNVTAFLTTVWRSGALFGTTAAEAFYVKCDAETNPPELRDLGQVVTEIGVAIVRPAEFVIFRISQFTAPGA
jgi:phage tail sheath protein FI